MKDFTAGLILGIIGAAASLGIALASLTTVYYDSATGIATLDGKPHKLVPVEIVCKEVGE